MMPAKDFNELRVYQTAFAAAGEIFSVSQGWPPWERYSLTDQIRRSSRSVCANIAEGFRKRRYPAAFVSRLSDADAEAGETLVWLEFAHRCRYIDELKFDDLTDRYRRVCSQLVLMMNRADRWCGPNTAEARLRHD